MNKTLKLQKLIIEEATDQKFLFETNAYQNSNGMWELDTYTEIKKFNLDSKDFRLTNEVINNDNIEPSTFEKVYQGFNKNVFEEYEQWLEESETNLNQVNLNINKNEMVFQKLITDAKTDQTFLLETYPLKKPDNSFSFEGYLHISVLNPLSLEFESKDVQGFSLKDQNLSLEQAYLKFEKSAISCLQEINMNNFSKEVEDYIKQELKQKINNKKTER